MKKIQVTTIEKMANVQIIELNASSLTILLARFRQRSAMLRFATSP